MKIRVFITLKAGVLDPQGKAVLQALSAMGFDQLRDVRQGKVIELDLDESDPEKAAAAAREMCERLLANTVIEDYTLDIQQ